MEQLSVRDRTPPSLILPNCGGLSQIVNQEIGHPLAGSIHLNSTDTGHVTTVQSHDGVSLSIFCGAYFPLPAKQLGEEFVGTGRVGCGHVGPAEGAGFEVLGLAWNCHNRTLLRGGERKILDLCLKSHRLPYILTIVKERKR